MPLKISKPGLDFIKSFESFVGYVKSNEDSNVYTMA